MAASFARPTGPLSVTSRGYELVRYPEELGRVTELRRRRDDVIEHGLPYLVADIDGAVVGYSYATLYRDRSAYRYTVEDSVYVDQGVNGKGVGRALLSA